MNDMSLDIIKDDIAKMSVNAIINAANSSPLDGCEICNIHYKSDLIILNEYKKAVITTAGLLDPKYVLHIVEVVLNGEELSTNCYINSFQLAVENNCKSITLPFISFESYRYLRDKAL